MTRSIKVAAVSIGIVMGTFGCSSFLTGDKLTNDPNNPSQATPEQLFVGVQANMFTSQENSSAMTVCMWMQQCAGVGGRFVDQFGRYVVNEFSWDGNWFQVYTGGGLIDLRKIEDAERAAGDSVFLGIAKIWEAFDVGVAADLWGDVPYTEAVGGNPTPTLDPQAAVYDSVQSLLSQAIAELAGPGTGPLGSDLVYGGDKTKWIAAAHTLKARFLLHTVEAAANKAAVYGNVITEATAGIADTTGDLRAFHSTATSERNIWYQFQTTTFGQDLVAGKALVDIMKRRSDPRLPQYFAKNGGGGYGGEDKNNPQPGDSISPLHGIGGNTSLRMCPTPSTCGAFHQPLVTYQERELMLAEAYNQTSQDPLALTHLNNARAVPGLLPLVGVTGAALLDSIMTEKYVALYQNIEVWNDYRRTCLPALTPYNTGSVNPQWRGKIPGRFFYGGTEMNVNPHIPDPGTQLSTNGFRNANDPADCP
jgi:starch-binding outer membrane protein, SusD/RagB family